MKNRNNEATHYAVMGMAALIPGMQYMLEQMQRTLNAMRTDLAVMQHGGAPEPRVKGNGYGWTNMTAEERSVEMKRRQAIAKRKHGANARWAKMSKTEKANWKAKMIAGRRKAKAKRHAAERAAERELARSRRRVNSVITATTVNHEAVA